MRDVLTGTTGDFLTVKMKYRNRAAENCGKRYRAEVLIIHGDGHGGREKERRECGDDAALGDDPVGGRPSNILSSLLVPALKDILSA